MKTEKKMLARKMYKLLSKKCEEARKEEADKE